MKTRILLAALIISSLFSCTKDKTSDDQNPIFEASLGGVYISNEGQFTNGNASVSYYGGSTQNVVGNAYYAANREALGDICQSMYLINDKIYLVVNNSGKIVVTNAFSMMHTGTITGFTSPRYFLPVTSTKAYVTDLYSNQISVVDLTSNTITGHIPLNGSSEALLLHNGYAYVTNMSTSELYKINVSTDNVSDSVQVSPGGNSICEDKDGKIWVLGGGDYLTGAPGGLTRIDPATGDIELSLTFGSTNYPTKLRINSTGDTLFYIDNHIYKMAITDIALPSTPFVVSGGRSLYGLGYDNATNLLYVSDAKDFQQNGRIYRYNTNGALIDNFAAGIAPGDFLFLH